MSRLENIQRNEHLLESRIDDKMSKEQRNPDINKNSSDLKQQAVKSACDVGLLQNKHMESEKSENISKAYYNGDGRGIPGSGIR